MRLFSWRAALTLGGAVALCAGALLVRQNVEASSKATVGAINYVRGEATRAPAGSGRTAAVKKGTKLYEGDKLKTGDDGRLEAKLADGSMVRLGSGSELSLENVTFNPGREKKHRKFRAKLVVGRVWAAVRSLFGSDNDFEVETSNAVAGVRGTRFSASQSASGETLVKVYNGKVLVSNRPIYAIKGHTKEKRQVVAGPQEVSKKQWEELVAGAMQMIRVAANGDMAKPQDFQLADASKDDWEAWNAERDEAGGFTGK